MKYRKLKYIIGLLLLIIVAFQLPKSLFALQDKEHMGEVGRGGRDGINFAALAENYEPSMEKRLARLADGLKRGNDYYVAEVAFELSEAEKAGILQEALMTDTLCFLNYAEAIGLYKDNPKSSVPRYGVSWSVLLELCDDGITVADWKKYVIYDAENINLICWYVDVFLNYEHEIRMLIDAEDGTIYYTQAVRDGTEDGTFYYGWGDAIDKESNGAVNGEKVSFAAWDAEIVALFWGSTKLLYNADYSEDAGEWKNLVRNYISADREHFSENAADWKNFLIGFTPRGALAQVKNQLKEMGFGFSALDDLIWQEINITGNKAHYPMRYGENALDFELEYDWENPIHREHAGVRIQVGFTDIGNLVSVFKK